MAFQAVPDTAEIDMVYTTNGEPAQNVFYAELAGGYAIADLQALADKIDLAWAATFQPDQVAETSYVKTVVRGLAFANDLIAEQSLSAGAGTHIGNSLPNNVTFSVKKFSGLTGRSARGRCYWIGIPNNQLQTADENLLEVAYAAAVVANIDFIRAQINTVGLWEAVLVSRFADGAKRATGKTFPWTGTTNVNLVVDTQRGRLP